MINNMSVIDRIIRLIIAIVLVIIYFTAKVSGLWAIILWLVVLFALFTSSTGYCPVYHLLGISTKDLGKKK